MKLVIVESPAKCSKIQGFLGDGYRVQATMGHIRSLEENLDSVGIDRNWEPKYKELGNKKDAISKLRTAAKGAEVILATDDDREGEGIAWHVCFLLKLNPLTTPRIVFHEITKPAILRAVANPRILDMNKVNAQQARSMLDLLVGFTISRVLWNRVAAKLSAGRCQTPALRLVVERDEEVDSHKAASFWRLSGTFQCQNQSLTIPGQAQNDIATSEEASNALKKVHKNENATVLSVKESVSTSQAPKPFITSTLQQEASTLYNLNPKVTMQAAQKLYEAGHITYMRTDNPFISSEAAKTVRTYVTETYGQDYVGAPGQHILVEQSEVKETKETKETKTKKTTTKKTAENPEAQAAHEAIRPTHPEQPDPLLEDPIQKKLYTLIWRRTTQCQMAPSQTDVRKANVILDADSERVWNLEQTKTKFAGWRILENTDKDKQAKEASQWQEWTNILQPAAKLRWTEIQADEMFTKPKGRYTEASLIAELEKRGIGRPSTFATLISTILERDYVEKTNVEGRSQDSKHLKLSPNIWPPKQTTESHKVGAEKNKLRSTGLGKSVIAYLVREYADLFNYSFTATMEQGLDEIAKANKPWKTLLQDTWDTYRERYLTHTTGGAGVNKAAKERQLSAEIKVILSRKGPLFVKEAVPPEKKATFAPLPSNVSFESATLADAETAFIQASTAKQGDKIGMLETEEIRKKKGPYGLYAECKGIRIPLKGEETLEQIQEKLIAKISFQASETAFSRVVGEFTIKKGPYGLYFYKHALKRVSFVKFPAGLDPEKVNAVDLQALYSAGIQKKRKSFPKKKEDA